MKPSAAIPSKFNPLLTLAFVAATVVWRTESLTEPDAAGTFVVLVLGLGGRRNGISCCEGFGGCAGMSRSACDTACVTGGMFCACCARRLGGNPVKRISPRPRTEFNFLLCTATPQQR